MDEFDDSSADMNMDADISADTDAADFDECDMDEDSFQAHTDF